MIRSSGNTQEMLRLSYFLIVNNRLPTLPNNIDELDRKCLDRCFYEDFANLNQGFLLLIKYRYIASLTT